MQKPFKVQQYWTIKSLRQSFNKISLCMKLSVLFLFCSLGLVQAAESYAQKTKISIEITEQTVGSVLEKIESQTDFDFFFNNKHVDLNRLVSVSVDDKNVFEVLDIIFAGTDVNYSVLDKKIVLTSSTQGTKQESITIKGKVIATNGDPIIGATVLEQGTNNGTVTDMDGNFTLNVKSASASLSISYVGYKDQHLKVQVGGTMFITLAEDTEALEEVVVVGYGKQSRAKVTSAISKLDGSKLVNDMNVSSFDQALASKMPGVNIQQSSGAPGAGVQIKIRGSNSINYSGQPLIVVDGVPLSANSSSATMQGETTGYQYNSNPLSMINPADIESIDVLKDAASAAIYGSRGSNGVIIITTKQGKVGKTKVNLSMYAGVSEVTKKVDVMDAYELANFTKMSRDLAYELAGGNPNDPMEMRTNSNHKYPSYMIPYINGQKGLVNTDWQDEIYRSAFQQSYDINVSGGTEKMNYYVSGNFTDQDGIIINTGMKRYSVRTNLNANITDRLKFGLRMSATQSDNKLVRSEDAWSREGLVITALMYHPNLPAYNADGSIATDHMLIENKNGVNVAQIQNPVALAMMVKNELTTRNFSGNADLEYTILDGLKLKTSFGVESIGMHRIYYRPKGLSARYEMAPTTTYNVGDDTRSSIFNWISETNLTYSKSFAKHDLEALLNFSAQKERSEYTYLHGTNFPNDNVTTLNAASVTNGSSYAQEAAMISFLGRVMYSYDNKYMLTASLRRDGSSRFAKNSRWGWFPSVSAGWNISREAFYPENALVNNLKFRASYGITGNANIPYYGGTAVLSASNYVFGGSMIQGFAPGNSPNQDLSWESTATTNIGLDFSLFDSKLNVAVDAYQSETSDLLLNVTVPASSGFTSALQNLGKIRNKGLEIMLSTSQQFGKDWSWDGSLTFATNKNEVVELAPGQEQILYSSGLSDGSYIVKVGESLGSFYGYRVDGIFTSQEQFDSTPHLEGQKQGVGDFIYADINGDKKVDANDRTIIGNANPDFTWGFNNTLRWKNIDLGFGLEGKHGGEIFNATHRYLAEAWGNNLAIYGTKEAPRTVWAYGTKSHTRPSSWHVEDASFIRIRNISLGYTFRNVLGINMIRLYASATNPFTFTDYSGYNPEVSNKGGSAIIAGEDFGNYPVSKSYVFGINVSF